MSAMEFERGGVHQEEFMRTVIGLAGLEMSHDEFEQQMGRIGFGFGQSKPLGLF